MFFWLVFSAAACPYQLRAAWGMEASVGKADPAALNGLWLGDCRAEDAADPAEEQSQVLAALAAPTCELRLPRHLS